MIGPEGTAGRYARGDLGWTLGKVLHPEGGGALEQAPPGGSHGTKPGNIQEAFGQCPQTYGVNFVVVLCRSWTQ